MDHLVTKCREIHSYAIFEDTEEDLQPAVSFPGTEEGHCGAMGRDPCPSNPSEMKSRAKVET